VEPKEALQEVPFSKAEVKSGKSVEWLPMQIHFNFKTKIQLNSSNIFKDRSLSKLESNRAIIFTDKLKRKIRFPYNNIMKE
jgi:hypothetical protein